MTVSSVNVSASIEKTQKDKIMPFLAVVHFTERFHKTCCLWECFSFHWKRQKVFIVSVYICWKVRNAESSCSISVSHRDNVTYSNVSDLNFCAALSALPANIRIAFTSLPFIGLIRTYDNHSTLLQWRGKFLCIYWLVPSLCPSHHVGMLYHEAQ